MRRILATIALLLVAALSFAGDRKSIALFTGAAGDTTAVGMADSTGILDTSKLEHMFLHIKPSRPCRVAIQIRQHGITDTSGVSLRDSTQSASWPWRAYVGAAGTLSTQTDSTVWKEVTAPTSVVAGEDEMVIEFGDLDGTSGLKWWGIRGKYIPIREVDTGAWYWARNTSIRLRVLTAGGAVTWTANLEGTTLP